MVIVTNNQKFTFTNKIVSKNFLNNCEVTPSITNKDRSRK
jgi:hypothetical protein